MRCVLVFSALMCAAGLRMKRNRDGNTTERLPTHELDLAKVNLAAQWSACFTGERGCVSLPVHMLQSCCNFCPFESSCDFYWAKSKKGGYIQQYAKVDNTCAKAPIRSVKLGEAINYPGFPATEGAALLLDTCYEVKDHFPADGWRKSMKCHCQGKHFTRCNFFMTPSCTGDPRILGSGLDKNPYYTPDLDFACLSTNMVARASKENCFSTPATHTDILLDQSEFKWTRSNMDLSKIQCDNPTGPTLYGGFESCGAYDHKPR